VSIGNKFSDLQLALINKQAALYTCECPVHVGMQITNLRKLYDYQQICMQTPAETEVQMQVHQRIAEVTKQAHDLMEQCLGEVLDLEGWDKTKLEMPEGIRKRVES
jgi:hypothetical protein